MILDAIKSPQTWSKTWLLLLRDKVARLRLHLRLRLSPDWSNEKSMCPIQFVQIQFENALVAHTHRHTGTPGPQLASTSGTAPARLDSGSTGMARALLMSFYCASGVLIAAIFNLIYAPVAQRIDFTIKTAAGRREQGAGGGGSAGLSQFHNAFCMFSRVSRICLPNALWPGCARMYTHPLCPPSFVCLLAGMSFGSKFYAPPPLCTPMYPPICSCTPNRD